MDTVGLVNSAIVILGSVVILYYARRESVADKLLGMSVLVLGFVLLLRNTYDIFPVSLLEPFRIGFTVIFAGLFYLAGGRQRRAVPSLVVMASAWLALPYIPLWAIFGYAFLFLAIVDSHDLSNESVRSQQPRKYGVFSRAFMLPFSAIQKAVMKRYGGRHLQRILFGGYFVYELAIVIIIPALAAIVSGQLLLFWIPGLVFFLVPTIKWMVKR